MKQHCQECPSFDFSFDDLPDGHVAIAASMEDAPQTHKNTHTTSNNSLALGRFLQRVPVGNKWRERQCELGLITVQNYEGVVRSFSFRSHVSFGEPHYESENTDDVLIVRVGRKLACIAKASLENHKLQRSFAYFQILLALSYCDFLLKKGVSVEVVDQLVKTIADVRQRDREQLLKTIPWIHELINMLVCQGWPIHRATELFFLGKMPRSSFQSQADFKFIGAMPIKDLLLIRNDANFDLILRHLSTEAFVKWKYDDCLVPHYTFPGLIASLLGSAGVVDQE
jgi:hypothetical protein